MTAMLDSPRPAKRSMIPWIFVAGMAVVIAVNAVMITFAIRSWTGLVVEKPYEQGIAYNRIIEAQHRQDALGWRFTVQSPVAGDNLLRLSVAGPDGQPVEGLTLDTHLERPIEVMPDVPLVFHQTAPGRFVAAVPVPKPGQWALKIDARRGEDRFHFVERLVLK